MQSPQIAARSPTPSPSPTRGEGSQISFWCEIPPLPLWERGQGERGFTDFASALMFHSNLMDIPNWFPLTSPLGITGPIDGHRAHMIINSYTVAFFDRHLKGLPATLLGGPVESYPDVRFESRRP